MTRSSAAAAALVTGALLASPDLCMPTHAQPVVNIGARLHAAAEYSRAHGGDVLLVVSEDAVIFEDYRRAAEPGAVYPLGTATIGFVCAAAAAAFDDQLLRRDQSAADVLPELGEDQARRTITIDHLIRQTSGLASGGEALNRPSLGDRQLHALRLPLTASPGARFDPGPSHTAVFAEALRRVLAKSNQNVATWLERRVFSQIGLRGLIWRRDVAGNPVLDDGAALPAREWAKFGVVMKTLGMWEATRVLGANHVRSCLQGSAAMPLYGVGWWLNSAPPTNADAAQLPFMLDGPEGALYADAPRDMAVAAGVDGQRLYVVPSLDLVIVRLGRADAGWRDRAFLARLLYGRG